MVYFEDDPVPDFFALDGTLLHRGYLEEDSVDLPHEHWMNLHTSEVVHPAILPEVKEAVIKMGAKYRALPRWYGRGLLGVLSPSMIEAMNAEFKPLVEQKESEQKAEATSGHPPTSNDNEEAEKTFSAEEPYSRSSQPPRGKLLPADEGFLKELEEFLAELRNLAHEVEPAPDEEEPPQTGKRWWRVQRTVEYSYFVEAETAEDAEHEALCEAFSEWSIDDHEGFVEEGDEADAIRFNQEKNL
jgi:hypothetical protein